MDCVESDILSDQNLIWNAYGLIWLNLWDNWLNLWDNSIGIHGH